MGGPSVPGPQGSRLPAVQRVPRPGDGDTADQAGQLRHTARQQALLFVTKLEFALCYTVSNICAKLSIIARKCSILFRIFIPFYFVQIVMTNFRY